MVVLTFDGFDVQYLIALSKKTGDTVWKRRGVQQRDGSAVAVSEEPRRLLDAEPRE